MGEDLDPQRLVVELVGERSPERERSAAVEERVRGLEERTAEKVEVLGHGLAPRGTPAQQEEQRRSFAYGNTKIENDLITRQMIDEAAERLAKKS